VRQVQTQLEETGKSQVILPMIVGAVFLAVLIMGAVLG
jgi:hypothetical protein